MNPFEKELLACCLDHRVIGKEDANLHIISEFSFSASFTGFQGHFPVQPVLPAVIQLTMVRLLAEQVLTRRLYPSQYGKTKFRHIVEPDQIVNVDLKLHFTDEKVDCQFQLNHMDGRMISDGSCTFTCL